VGAFSTRYVTGPAFFRALLTPESVAEALTYTKLLSGSTVIQVVAYLGYRLGGWTAAAVCTAAFLLPSVFAMGALAYAYAQIESIPAVASIRRGVLAAVVGLLMLTTYRLAKPVFTGVLQILLGVGALAVAMLTPVNTAWIVLVAGLVGVAIRR
jgi:chromate transporter